MTKSMLSINFPWICKNYHQKEEKWEIGFNLQELMSDNHIVLSGFLLRKLNDFNTLKRSNKQNIT